MENQGKSNKQMSDSYMGAFIGIIACALITAYLIIF